MSILVVSKFLVVSSRDEKIIFLLLVYNSHQQHILFVGVNNYLASTVQLSKCQKKKKIPKQPNTKIIINKQESKTKKKTTSKFMPLTSY